MKEQWNDYGIYQWISKNEVSNCVKIDCATFDNFYFFFQEDVIFEIKVANATVR